VTRGVGVRRHAAPLVLDAVAVLAGGYAINMVSEDGFVSWWWWVLVAASGIALVASGVWSWWIESTRSEGSAEVVSPVPDQSLSGTGNKIASAGDAGGTSFSNGNVSISASDNSFAAWNVTGPVTLGGTPRQPRDVDDDPPKESRAND